MIRYYTYAEKQYIRNSWGRIPIKYIAKKLDRTPKAIKQKAQKMGLKDWFFYADFEETVCRFYKRCFGTTHNYTKLIRIMENTGFKFNTVQLYKRGQIFKTITENEFINWLKQNKHSLNIGNTEDGCFSVDEPKWLKEKRKIDRRANVYTRRRDWSDDEINRLIALVKSYKYTYRDISIKLKRTEPAIKRKLLDLGIKERPISVQNTTKWTKEEIDIVKNLYERGYPTIIIAEYLSRSQLSIDNLFDNMKKREKRNQLNNTKSVYEYLKVEYEQKKAG